MAEVKKTKRRIGGKWFAAVISYPSSGRCALYGQDWAGHPHWNFSRKAVVRAAVDEAIGKTRSISMSDDYKAKMEAIGEKACKLLARHNRVLVNGCVIVVVSGYRDFSQVKTSPRILR